MPWKPTEEESKFVSCVGRMSLDCLAENGTSDRATYVKNLRGIARCLDRLPSIPKPERKSTARSKNDSEDVVPN